MVKGRSRTGVPAAAAAIMVVAAAGCGSGADATPKITTTARAGVAPTPPKQGAYFGAWVPPGRSGGAAASPSPDGSGKPSGGPGGPDGSDGSDGSGHPSGATGATGGSGGPGGSDGSGHPSGATGGSGGPGGSKPGPASVAGFERALGRQLDIVQSYRGWESEFPSKSDEAVLAGNRYLLLTWAGTDTKEIVKGKHDRLIKERARAVKATGKPVFLRWQRDMDKSGLQGKTVHSPADFIAAWKRLRGIFKAEKVDNVAWVWCPTARGFGSRDAPAYYPGDDQVDWICADAQPGGDYDYRDLSEALKLFLEWARGRPKPIMVAEFGVPESYASRRAEWLRKAAETLQDPQVKAVVYFNSDEQAQDARDKRRMFSVEGDTKATSALREIATTPYFNPRNLPVTSGG